MAAPALNAGYPLSLITAKTSGLNNSIASSAETSALPFLPFLKFQVRLKENQFAGFQTWQVPHSFTAPPSFDLLALIHPRILVWLALSIE